MATKQKAVDVVVEGVGWSGSILAEELTDAGLEVLGLERGKVRQRRTRGCEDRPQHADVVARRRFVERHAKLRRIDAAQIPAPTQRRPPDRRPPLAGPQGHR